MHLIRVVMLVVVAVMLCGITACTTSKRPRSDRDPYVTDSSSDPKIGVGNPY